MKVALASALLGCALVVPAHAEDCKHSANRTASSAGPNIERVVVEAGAGDLVVRGGQGQDVKVDGKACAPSAKLLEETRLEIRREGTTVYVRTVLPEMSGILFGSNYAHMDVTVAVPKTATLKIEDSSGDMEVTDVQAAAIQDSSGDQTLERIAGALEVQDSSGEIKIAGVGGGLRLRDSSGDVDVDNVQGDVVVDVDSTGDLDIRRVTGGGHVREDGSGDVDVHNVQGDVVADVDSSAGLGIRRVTGGVHVREDSSGDIEIHDVKRDVTVDDDSSGSILVQDVGGNFTVGSDGSGSIR